MTTTLPEERLLTIASRILKLYTKLRAAEAEIARLKATPAEKREDLYCVISDLSKQVTEAEARAVKAERERDVLGRALSELSELAATFSDQCGCDLCPAAGVTCTESDCAADLYRWAEQRAAQGQGDG